MLIMDKHEVLQMAKSKGVKFVRLQFVDLLGNAKCCNIPASRLEKVLNNGISFDGSSVEGYVRTFESDLKLVPDPNTFNILPWTNGKEARIYCDLHTPDGKHFEGDPRYILKKEIEKAKEMGLHYSIGPELEFFLFKKNNGTLIPQDDGGYFELSPIDKAIDMKLDVMWNLEELGFEIELGHHEVSPGQHEIDFKHGDALTVADAVITYKNTVKEIALKNDPELIVSFMPKPVQGINGSGMHCHQSLWSLDKKKNLMYDENDKYELSKVAYQFIAGQLKYIEEICAITNPTVNSYKRLVLGYEAPVYICWGRKNRSALIRVPYFPGNEGATRAELRCPDPSCNPYLAFAVMLEAGLSGIKEKLEPPESVEEDVFDFDDAKLAKYYIHTLPSSLKEAMEKMRKGNLAKKVLGEFAVQKLLEAQEKQWSKFMQSVTEWEIKEYLKKV